MKCILWQKLKKTWVQCICFDKIKTLVQCISWQKIKYRHWVHCASLNHHVLFIWNIYWMGLSVNVFSFSLNLGFLSHVQDPERCQKPAVQWRWTIPAISGRSRLNHSTVGSHIVTHCYVISQSIVAPVITSLGNLLLSIVTSLCDSKTVEIHVNYYFINTVLPYVSICDIIMQVTVYFTCFSF